MAGGFEPMLDGWSLDHQPSEWLRAKLNSVEEWPIVKARLDMEGRGKPPTPCLVLDFGNHEAGDREDFTCDKCREFRTDGLWTSTWPLLRNPRKDTARLPEMSTLELINASVLLVTIGLCDRCTDEEGLPHGTH